MPLTSLPNGLLTSVVVLTGEESGGESGISVSDPSGFVISGVDGQGIVQSAQPYGLAISFNYDGDNAVDLWNVHQVVGTDTAGFTFMQKHAPAVPHRLGRLYGDSISVIFDFYSIAAQGATIRADTAGVSFGSFGASSRPVALQINTDVPVLTLNTDLSAMFAGPVTQRPLVSATPVNNGDLVVQATSNTQLTFKLKGTDGVVRSGNLTLA